jgi:hypothetical protein
MSLIIFKYNLKNGGAGKMMTIIVILAILILIVNAITIYIDKNKLNQKTRIISLILTF